MYLKKKNDSNRYEKTVYFLLFSFLSILNLRFFFKYVSFPLAVFTAYFIVTLLAFYIAIFNKNDNMKIFTILSRKSFIFLLFLVMTVSVVLIYPIADNLKLQMRGSDQDDCIILGVSNLLDLHYPYSNRSYYGNPCSPGFGALIIYTPFVALNIYELGSVFFISMLSILVFRKTKNIKTVGLFLTLFLSCILALELMVVGSDLIAVGCLLAIISIMITDSIQTKRMILLYSSAVLCGLVASSRVNFLPLTILFPILIFPHWKKGALYFFFISIGLAIIPSTVLLLINPDQFTPLHLINKANAIVQSPYKEIMFIITAMMGFFGVLDCKKDPENLPLIILICLTPGLAAVALGDLIVLRDWEIKSWEGENYLAPLIPLLAYKISTIRIRP